MNKQVTKLFRLLVMNELFDGVEKVALLDGHTTKIHATPDGGLTIYADYSDKEVALSVYRRGPDGVGMGFPTLDGTNRLRLAEDVLKAALRKLLRGELTNDKLTPDRFREICQTTSSRKIGMSPSRVGFSLPGSNHTLDQWFSTKGK